MQRQTTLQIPFGAGDLGTVQAAGDHHLNTLCPESLRFFYRLFHRPAKSDTLFELLSDLLGLKLSVQFRMMDLLDRDKHFAARLTGKIFAKLVDLRPFASDDNSWPRGVDDDLHAGSRAFDINMRDTAAAELSL